MVEEQNKNHVQNIVSEIKEEVFESMGK